MTTPTITESENRKAAQSGHPSAQDVEQELVRVERHRQTQLDALPDPGLDPVATAYRDSIVRILDEVRTALRRLREGQYGVCTGCDSAIAPERLELRPWATTCPGCAPRERG